MINSCTTPKKEADTIFKNGRIYTVDFRFTIAESFAVKDGKFVSTGTDKEIADAFTAKEVIDLGGMPVYPGFIDAHCHFVNYGFVLQEADLSGTRSFDEVVDRVAKYGEQCKSVWIRGRGWDQNDWPVKEFPTREALDKLFPHTPVYLTRIDGHAALVNQEALMLAKITTLTKVDGGEVEVKNGKLTGILIDNAMDMVSDIIPRRTENEISEAILLSQKKCLRVGLTTVDDAGLTKRFVNTIDSLHKTGELKMRVYAMLSPNDENKEYYFKHGIYKTDRLNVRSFKYFADGALGSRGACLLKPYSDKNDYYGLMMHPPDYFRKEAAELYKYGFQMNTHCIGDSANRCILDIYGEFLEEKNDLRWRIEHAQVVDEADFYKFEKLAIVPSVQPTHATSDMYWAEERLGKDRIKNAYAYKKLMIRCGKIACGSDFPIEDINPLYGFYAAASRKDQEMKPESGFQTENVVSREQALRGMTLWAAYANFEEKEKGTIEPGKFADFVVLEKDIMKASVESLFSIKVLSTYINGENVFSR